MLASQHKLGFNKVILLVDLLVFSFVSYLVATQIYDVAWETYIRQLVPALFVVGVSLYLLSAFEISLNVSLSSLLSRNLIAISLALAILLVIIFALGPGTSRDVYGRGVLLITTGIFSAYLLVTRFALFKYQRKKIPFHDWVFVGSDRHFQRLLKETISLPRHKFTAKSIEWLEKELDGTLDAGVILDDSLYADPELGQKLIDQKFRGATITSIDNFYQNYLEKVPLFHIREHWFISTEGFGYINDSIRQRVKRTMDLLIVVATAPVTLFTVMLLAAIIVLVDRQNPFFRQLRKGWHGRQFRILKLRTMRTQSSHNDSINISKDTKIKDSSSAAVTEWTTVNDSRVTKLGQFLRRYRLDELPQLYNVLVGNMSIIGPRPEQPDYTQMLEKTIPYYDIRHSIKPGITGWAQVKFPYAASVADSRSKLEYDLYYIKHYSLQLDLAILIKTFYTIFSGSGR